MGNKSLRDIVVKNADLGEVEAVFSTFNVVDKDGDVTLPGAIKDGAEVVISAYGHTSHSGLLPVGKGVIRTTDTEAMLDGRFFLDTAHGKDTFAVIKQLGPLQEWSYSLHDVTSHMGEFEGKRVQFLESISVKEVSPVLLGAGVNTRTVAAKGAQTLQEQVDEAMDVVSSVIDSAERVVALRAEKGKQLSQVNVTSLVGLGEALKRLEALLDSKAEEADPTEDISGLWLRYLQLQNQGV